MSVASTRCIAAFRLSVPESAWLISSSVERRRASRAAVVASAPDLAAGMAGLLHYSAVVTDSLHEHTSSATWEDTLPACTSRGLRPGSPGLPAIWTEL